ncbi:hypothetical protein SAMN05216553_101580 [Lentzea fradiae]|uniref:Peptide zinc metalloprotease protein n=1 Tax=Lentzea fradiae TaxID=200378 RepID=A0A1G7KZT5_9PSEU|nr:hypothetical protein [Lentzea fradiae]SDF42584.1 hypothetical protein SAMN05216553_101580 [Lentzea fradiae]
MTEIDLDRPVPLHPLVFLEDGDEVTIGRPDIDSYGMFPGEGAALVRRLVEGDTPREAAAWFEREYGEEVDIEDVLAGLDELDLVRRTGEEIVATTAPVRFGRLGAALFSPFAWAAYAVLAGWALFVMVANADLRPTYHNIFFSDYYMVIQVGLFLAAIPLLFLHESFHALAGRRLGVRSRLRIGRRLYFIVLETSLDGLVAVPRAKRYLPIVAGLLADVLGIAACTVAADLTRHPDGSLSGAGRFLLAVAFAALLRVIWQFFLYLRTDVYVLVSTVLGCVDLHGAAMRIVKNRFRRLAGKPEEDESVLHPVDRQVARWYSWLVVVGYTASLTTFALAGAPVLYRFVTGVLGRLTGDGVPTAQLLDSIVFGGVALAQGAVLGWLMVRERVRARRDRRLHHVIH